MIKLDFNVEIKSENAECLLNKAKQSNISGCPVSLGVATEAVIIAEQEAEERHANQLQELKNIIVDVRIETCSHRNGKICFVDMERCRGVECLKIKAFSNKLSQKLTEKQ